MIPPPAPLLHALAATYRMDLRESVARHIVSRVGWPAPYYLQLVFHQLRSVQGPVKDADVDRAIEDLLGPYHRSTFDYWRQRLVDELGREHAAHAVVLLNQCCRAPEGASVQALHLALAGAISEPAMREEQTRYLLDVLQNDGYLVEAGPRLVFRSPLLREYWRRRVAPWEEAQ